MRESKRAFIAFGLGFVGVVMAYVALIFTLSFLCSPPLFDKGELWLKNLYEVKDYINAQHSPKQRLLIVSGSNALFGFDGEMIAKESHFTPINYATHAGLPINYHIDKIIAHAQRGDIVVMPLEFGYYTREKPSEDSWYIKNMLLWGGEYRKFIAFKGIAIALVSQEPITLFKGAMKKILRSQSVNYGELNPRDKAKAIAIMEQKWQEKSHAFEGYNFRSLNPYGDFSFQQGQQIRINTGYLEENLVLSNFFISEFRRLLDFAKQNDIKIFLTYPATAENPAFSIESSATFRKIENLKSALKAQGISIYGDFRDFHFKQTYFFDTLYHLNAKGIKLRTKNFIRLLDELESRAKWQNHIKND